MINMNAHEQARQHLSAGSGGWRRQPWLRPGLVWFGFDLIAPTALPYALLRLGGCRYVALLASASVICPVTIIGKALS